MNTFLVFAGIVLAAVVFQRAIWGAEKAASDSVPTAADAALVAEAEKLFPLVQNTPGREAANFIFGEGWMHEQFLWLKGQGTGNLADARVNVGGRLNDMRKGVDWPVPEPCSVPRAKAPVTVDGIINAEEWQGALVLDKSYEIGSTTPGGPRSTWRLLWDADFLYVGFDCDDADIQAPAFKRDGALYDYDCAEIFILPDFKTLKYCEFIFNPSGSVYDALHTKHDDAWGEEAGGAAWTMKGLKSAVQIIKKDDKPVGYSIEVAIPFRELPGFQDNADPSNRTVYMMFVRGDKSGQKRGKDLKFFSYAPLLSWTHNIWNYGKFTFATESK